MMDLTNDKCCALFDSMLNHYQRNSSITPWFSGCMAVLVLLLSLASVSPALHHALHADEDSEHQCEGHHHDEAPAQEEGAHICAVTILDMGATVPIVISALLRVDEVLAEVSIEAQSIWCGQAPLRLSARAPPIVEIV